MKRTVVVGIVSSLFGTALADDTADIDIYLDYLVGQWQFGGTAPMNPLTTVAKRSHFYSVQVSMGANDTFETIHTWGGQPVAGFSAFEFYIRAAGTGTVNFDISARVLGNWRPAQPLSRYVTASAAMWKQVRIPLSDLGVNQNELLQRVKFQAGSGGAGTFYIDDVKLVAPPYTTTVSVNVNANSVLRTLDARMFGVGTFCWDPVMNIADTKQKVAAAGITFLNYPGGNSADIYDWQTNTHVVTGATAAVSTDTYLQFANEVGADKMLTVNYGYGTPEKAAAWVHHVNVVRNANVMYWSIGNESYHPDSYDSRTPPFQHDAETYAAFVRDCILQMKAVDPRIKIGVVGSLDEYSWPSRTTVFNPRTGAPANGWGAVVLSKLVEFGTLPDYWDFHWYSVAPHFETDNVLLQSPSRMDFLVNRMRQMIVDYTGVNIPVMLTENNSVWMPVGRQSTSLTNALYLVDFWATCNRLGLESFVWWNLHNGAETSGNFHPSLYGWRNIGTFGILSQGVPSGVADPLNTPYPTYYAFKQLSKFARPGDTLIEVSSNNPMVSVYGARRASDGKVRLIIVNKAKQRDYTLNISFAGYSPPSTMVAHRYGRSEDSGSRDLYRYSASTQLRTLGGLPAIRTTVQRYSITVLEL